MDVLKSLESIHGTAISSRGLSHCDVVLYTLFSVCRKEYRNSLLTTMVFLKVYCSYLSFLHHPPWLHVYGPSFSIWSFEVPMHFRHVGSLNYVTRPQTDGPERRDEALNNRHTGTGLPNRRDKLKGDTIHPCCHHEVSQQVSWFVLLDNFPERCDGSYVICEFINDSYKSYKGNTGVIHSSDFTYVFLRGLCQPYLCVEM